MLKKTLAAAVAALICAATPSVAQVVEGFEPVLIDADTIPDRLMGSQDAPVALKVYLGLTCADCSSWVEEVLAQLQPYIDAEEMNLVIRMAPTEPAEVSNGGAALVWCAEPQKHFEVISAMLAKVPAMQAGAPLKDWYNAGVSASGRGVEQIEACIASDDTRRAVFGQYDAYFATGLREIPAVFVNDVQVSDTTLAGMKAAILDRLMRTGAREVVP